MRRAMIREWNGFGIGNMAGMGKAVRRTAMMRSLVALGLVLAISPRADAEIMFYGDSVYLLEAHAGGGYNERGEISPPFGFNQGAYGHQVLSVSLNGNSATSSAIFAISDEGRNGRFSTHSTLHFPRAIDADVHAEGHSGGASFAMRWDDLESETLYVVFASRGFNNADIYTTGIFSAPPGGFGQINVGGNENWSGSTTFDGQIVRDLSFNLLWLQAHDDNRFAVDAYQSHAAVWGVGSLPGLSSTNPLDPDPTPMVDDQGNPVFSETGSVAIGGTYTFTLPVVDGYGLESYVYLDPEVATGYEYSAEGSRFSKFILPDQFPGGTTEFQLVVNDQIFNLFTGQEFNFRDIDQHGVNSFRLLGIPVTEGIDPNVQPPFVSGLSFTDPGVVTVTQWALTTGPNVSPVPEPSSAVMLGGCALGLWVLRRRELKRSSRNGQVKS